MKFRASVVFAAAALSVLSASAVAQEADETAVEAEQEEEGGDYPWGFLGLAGLVGLLGPGKRNRRIHVDARRNR